MMGLKAIRVLGILLLSLLLFDSVVPALAYSTIQGTTNINTNLASSQISNVYGFRTLFLKYYSSGPAMIPSHGNMILTIKSGSVALLSNSSRYVYFAENDEVHVMNLTMFLSSNMSYTSNNVSYVIDKKINGSLDYNQVFPRPAACGPNDTAILAPHQSNPYIVTPKGQVVSINVYDDTKNVYTYWLAGNGTHFAWSNSKGLVVFKVGRDLKTSVLKRFDDPALGGMVAISDAGLVAVIASNRSLYIFKLKDNVYIPLNGYIGVATPRSASYFYAVAKNGQIVRVDQDGRTENVTATSYPLISFTTMSVASTNNYDVIAVIYFSSAGMVLDILVVDKGGSPVSMKSFKVNAINVALRNYNGTVYFAASGYQTILGAVNGTRIGIYTIARETEGKPFVGGFYTYQSTAIDVVPAPMLLPYVENAKNQGLSFKDILVVDMLGDWGGARIRVYRPLSLSDTPHVELKGKVVFPSVALTSGKPSQIPLGTGEMIPFSITINVNKAVKAAGETNLVAGGPYLEWHDVSVRHSIVRFDELAYTKTLTSARMDGNVFSVRFNYTAVWHSQLFATGSVPAPSLGIIYYDLAPTKLSDYDRFLFEGRITSTQGIPSGAFSNVYGYGLAYGVTATIYMASGLIIAAHPSYLNRLWDNIELNKEVDNLLRIWDYWAEKISQATKAGKAAGVIQSSNLPRVIPVVTKNAIFEFEVPPIEELEYGSVAIMVSGTLKANLPSDLIDRAARAGITQDQIGRALAEAAKKAAQDAITASSATVSIDSQINAFIATTADILQKMQREGFYLNISGRLRYVDPHTASTFANAFVSAIGYYANAVSGIYNIHAKTSVTPSASLNTLRDVYYWSKYVFNANGYKEEDASKMATTPTLYVFLAAVDNATEVFAQSLQSKGIILTDEDKAKIEWNFILSVLGGTTFASGRNALGAAFPPPPSLVAEYFEQYLNENVGPSTSSVKQQIIKELASSVMGASMVVSNNYAVQGMTGTTLVWEFEKIDFGVVGLNGPLGAVWQWFSTTGWIPLALYAIEKGITSALVWKFGEEVLKNAALVTVGSIAEAASIFGIFYMGATLVMTALLVPSDKNRGGATTLVGVVFDVYDQGKRIGIFAMQKPPDVMLFNFLNMFTTPLDKFLKDMYEQGAGSFDYDKLIMDFISGDPSYLTVKDYLLHFVSNDATIRRVGIAYMVLGWIQPTPLTFSDTVATLSGKIDVSNFEFLGVNLKSEAKTVNATLPAEFWRRVNVRVYRDNALLGDMPFDHTGICLNNSCMYAVYSAPMLYSGATDISIEIPKDMGQIFAEVSIVMDVAILGELGTTHPYMAILSYRTNNAAFEPESFGIFNLDKIPGYPPKPLAAIQVEVIDSDPPPKDSSAKDNKLMIFGDDVLSGMVDGSPYNYIFADPRLMPVSNARRFKLQYWLYLNTSKPEQKDERDQTINHTQPLGKNPYKTKVTPSANETVVPPWLNVSTGNVGLSLYLNGTHSYSMLPRMLTAYVYTPEPNVSVNVYTWWVIEYENNTAKRWETAGYGPLYNVTITTPGGKYSAALNTYIGNYSDYAAYLARKLNTIVALKFFGKAVRLDNLHYDKAMAPVSLIYPDMQGNLTKDMPTITVYVYDALNRSALSGATVRIGSIYGTTDSSGVYTAQLQSGSYTVYVSKQGYYNYSMSIYLSRDYLLNVPLVPVSSSSSYTGWLIVQVRSMDGMPLANATVYINGTIVGMTDSDGAWYGLFKWGTVQKVKVSYLGWTSEERSLNITHSRVLTTFTASLNSDIFKPMVWAYAVYPVGSTSMYGNITLLGAVITNSNNTYTVEIGLKMNGTKVSYVRLTRTVRKPGADVFVVTLPSASRGRYVAYLNITWAMADNSPDDNYVESDPFSVYGWYMLNIYIIAEVVKWGKDIPGLIYPGETVYRINVTTSVLDVTGALNYQKLVRNMTGTKIKLARPIMIDLVKRSGTTVFVDEKLKTISLSEIPLGSYTVASYNVTAPFARFMTVTFKLPSLINGTFYADNETEMSINISDYTVKLPPHLIVKGIDYIERRVVRLGDNISVVLKVWTNYLPGEGTGGLLMLAFGKAENQSFIAYSVAKVPDMYDGEQEVRGKIMIPRDYQYNFSWWEPAKTVDVKFTVGRVPDSYSGDNYVDDTLTVLNTDSWVTWFLILFGILIAVLLLIAFINAIRGRDLSRVMMSEWFERVPEKTIPSRSVHRRRENNIFNLEWFERINKDEEK